MNALRDYSTQLYQKEDNLANKDKNAWSKYDKIEKNVQAMLKSVDDAALHHVSQLLL